MGTHFETLSNQSYEIIYTYATIFIRFIIQSNIDILYVSKINHSSTLSFRAKCKHKQFVFFHASTSSFNIKTDFRYLLSFTIRFEEESSSEPDEEFELPAKARVISASIGEHSI